MKSTYIQSAGIYPSPRNPQVRTYSQIKLVPHYTINSHDAIYNASKTTEGFNKKRNYANTIIPRDLPKSSLQLSRDSIPAYDPNNSKDKDHSTLSYVCATPTVLNTPTVVVNRKGPLYTPPSEQVPQGQKIKFIRKANIMKNRCSTPFQDNKFVPLINDCRQKVAILVQNFSPEAWQALKDGVGAVFDNLIESIMKSTYGQENSPEEYKKILEKINSEFAQARQAIWLNNASINIYCEKLGIHMKSLLNSSTRNNLNYSVLIPDSPDPTSIGDNLSIDLHPTNKSRCETPTIMDSKITNSDIPKIVEAQKELAKLLSEIKKKNERLKQYEDIFYKKDELFQTILEKQNDNAKSPKNQEKILLEKDKEIERLQYSLRNLEASLSRSSSRLDESDSVTGKIVRYKSEGSRIDLESILNDSKKYEELQEKLDTTRLDSEKNKQKMKGLINSLYTSALTSQKKIILRLITQIQSQSQRITLLEQRLKSQKNILARKKSSSRSRDPSPSIHSEEIQELRQNLIKVTASKVAIHKELIGLRKRISTSSLPAENIRINIRQNMQKFLNENIGKQVENNNKIKNLIQKFNLLQNLVIKISENLLKKQEKISILKTEKIEIEKSCNKKIQEAVNLVKIKYENELQISERLRSAELIHKNNAEITKFIAENSELKQKIRNLTENYKKLFIKFSEEQNFISNSLDFYKNNLATHIEKSHEILIKNQEKIQNIKSFEFFENLTIKFAEFKRIKEKIIEKDNIISEKQNQILVLENQNSSILRQKKIIILLFRNFMQKALKQQEISQNSLTSLSQNLDEQILKNKEIYESYTAMQYRFQENIEELTEIKEKYNDYDKIKTKLREKERESISVTRNHINISRKSQDLSDKLKTKEDTITILSEKIKQLNDDHEHENNELKGKINELREDIKLLKSCCSQKDIELEKTQKLLGEYKRKLENKNITLKILKRKIIEQMTKYTNAFIEIRENMDFIKETQKKFAETIYSVISKIQAAQIKANLEKNKLVKSAYQKSRSEYQQFLSMKEKENTKMKAKFIQYAKNQKKVLNAMRAMIEKTKENYQIVYKKNIQSVFHSIIMKIKERINLQMNNAFAERKRMKIKNAGMKLVISKMKNMAGNMKSLYKSIISEQKMIYEKEQKYFSIVLSKIISKKKSITKSPQQNKINAELATVKETLKSAQKQYWDLVATSAQEITNLKTQHETDINKHKSQMKEFQIKLDFAAKEHKNLASNNYAMKQSIVKCREIFLKYSDYQNGSEMLIKRIKTLESKILSVSNVFRKSQIIIKEKLKSKNSQIEEIKSVDELEQEATNEQIELLQQKLISFENSNRNINKMLEQEKDKNKEHTKIINKTETELINLLEQHGIQMKTKKNINDILKEFNNIFRMNTEIGTILKLQSQVKEKENSVFFLFKTNIKIKELTTSYVSKLEKLTNERNECVNNLKDIKEEYTILLSNLPIGTQETRLYRICVLLNISQREFEAAQKFRGKL